MRLINSEYLDSHTIPGKLIFNYFGNSMNNATFRVERDKNYLITKGASWGTTLISSSASGSASKELEGGVLDHA